MAAQRVDLTDPDCFLGGFPHEHFRELRARGPLHWHPEPDGPGFFAVVKQRELIEASKRPEVFSSNHGTNIDDMDPVALERVRTIMLNMDPPQHVKYRRLVRGGFTPKKIGALEPRVRQLAAEIVDGVARKGECDFVTEIAAELPLLVICELMGVPAEDRKLIFELSNRLIGFDDPEFQNSPDDGQKAATEMWLYAHQLGEKRRREPKDDLISALLAGRVDGASLSELEFNNFFLLLAVAGNETTRNAISGGMLALMQHPDQRRRLIENPALIDTAIEEIVRWVSPVMYFRRTATKDTTLGGQAIRAGQKIVMYYLSANRDEDVFDDPFRFDVGRDPNPHVGFGIGEHFCLGSHLARQEIRVVFEELLRRLPDMELAAEPRRLRSNFIHGIKEMRVRYTPER
jgi:cholest-4-en-3-one 26-monooxygenase